MIILGIDPGIAKFGYGFVARHGSKLSYLHSGVLKTPAHETMPSRLASIMSRLTALCDETPPDHIVIERLIPGPGRNLGKVAEVRGIVLLFAGQKNILAQEVHPRTLKILTTRSGSAEKLQMRKTVQRLLNLPQLPLADAADALALAILGEQRGVDRFS